MVQPRARSTRKVIDSDEESTRASSQATSRAATVTPRASTKNSKPSQKKQQPPTSVKGTLHSFFNAATQAQISSNGSNPRSEVVKTVEPVEDIEDDALDNKNAQPRRPVFRADSRKRSSDAVNGGDGTIQHARKLFKTNDGSRRATPDQTAVKDVVDTDARPWSERYAPRTLDELVVHKKKVADVRQWLQASLQGQRHKRLLILKGPAGSGKTTTLHLLSEAMHFSVIEWKNPTLQDYDSGSYVSMASHFEDFLGRGGRYGGLQLVDSNDPEPRGGEQDANSAPIDGPVVLLIEEFPTNIQRSGAASLAFRSSIMQVLSASTATGTSCAPLILIISESLMSGTSSEDNFTAHRLLGAEILHHPSTALIEFNAVASTFVSKALSTVLRKRSRDVGRYYAPHQDVLKRLSEFGDVRNATSTLEMVCVHAGDQDTVQSAVKRATSAKSQTAGGKADPRSQAAKEAALGLVTLRESSIGLFHAVGKVLYNKRLLQVEITPPGDLPDHLMMSHARVHPSEVEVDILMDETGTDTSTFLSALHENYPPSCTPQTGDMDASLDVSNGCLDALGDADILGNLGAVRQGRFANSGEGLRQLDLAFQVGVRGILFHLPQPVKRTAMPGKSKSDAFRMFYPADLKLRKDTEESRDLLHLLTSKMLDGKLMFETDTSHTNTRSISQPGRVPDQLADVFESRASDIREPVRTMFGGGRSAYQEMLLERLPYLIRLMSTSAWRVYTPHRNSIHRATRFSGIRVSQDDAESDDLEATAFTNLPLRGKASSGLGFIGTSTNQEMLSDDHETPNLGLLDDDIEDD